MCDSTVLKAAVGVGLHPRPRWGGVPGLGFFMDFALAVVIATGIVFAVMYWYYYQIGKVEQAAKQNS